MEIGSKRVFNLPWFFIGLTFIPIFVVAIFFPAHANSEIWMLINDFIDAHLLGVVGFWSSNFPFGAKVITNYISLLGPVFGCIVFFLTRQTLVLDVEYYKGLSFYKYIFCLVGMTCLFVFIFWINYFSFEDIATKQKMRVFALNPIVYSLFSSVLLFSCYLSFIFIYIVYYYLPVLFYKRYFAVGNK